VRRFVKSQDGVALPVASAMMLVISLFVVAFFTVSLRLNDTSLEDRSSKRALAAAEAGLQLAVYQLGQLSQLDTPPAATKNGSCLTDTWVTPATGGECPGHPVVLGNGAQVTYYVTPLLAPGADCVLRPGETETALDRCVTAVGTVDGVSRRLQVRVANTPAPVTFKQVGLMGKSLVFAGNSSEITSDVGTNGTAHFGNSAKTFASAANDVDGTIMLGPSGNYQTEGSGQVIAGGQVSVPEFEFPAEPFEAAENSALNAQAGWAPPSGSTYDATTRTFTIDSGTVTMPPGTYHFCRVFLNDGLEWNFSDTTETRIYIDSPSRSDSVCAGPPPQADPSGTFWANNSVGINRNGREELLDIFVYGTTQDGTRSVPSWCAPGGSPPKPEECRSDFILDNSIWFEGSVYAPNTTVEANNSVTWIGAIGADSIRFNNSVKFQVTSAVKDSDDDTSGTPERRGWIECQPQATVAGDPESGC
jgi:hypothetical protein